MRRHVATAILILLAIAAGARSVQNGTVSEYLGKTAKRALSGVELAIYPAQSAVSDRNGAFRLEFLTLKPGDKIKVRRVAKDGYVVFNKDALEQWVLSPSAPFTIVMCRADLFKKLKDTYYKNSGERYARQYRNAQNELTRLKNQNKLLQKDYEERLRRLEEEYARQLENLDSYVDRFARIDLSEISPVEQEIVELVQQGEIDQAIARYESLNARDKLVEGLSKRAEVKKLDAELARDNDTLYAVVERQIQTLQLGGAENNEKIRRLYCDIADADTTNTAWVCDAARFLSVYMGYYREAIAYYQKALPAADDADRLKILVRIGVAYDNLGDYPKALDYIQKGLDAAGDDNPDLPLAYNGLGVVYVHLGEFDKALEFTRKTLEADKKILGDDHPDIAVSYVTMGIIYRELEDYENAIKYYQKALDIQQQFSDEYNTDLATTYNNIGSFCNYVNKPFESLEYLTKALEIYRLTYGEDHPLTATAYHNIGAAYFYAGDYENAVSYYLKAAETRSRLLGENHPDLGLTYYNMAVAYCSMKDFEKSLDYYRKAIAIDSANFGDDCQKVALSIVGVGSVYYYMGRFDLAIENYLKALKLTEPTSPDATQILASVAVSYYNLKDFDSSIKYYQQAIATTADPLTEANYCNDLCCVFYDKGDYDKALEHGLKAVELLTETDSGDSCDLAEFYSNIASACEALGRADDAARYSGMAAEIEAARQ